MQDGFFQKLTLCIIIGALAAGLIEFYRTFITGADQALNGGRQTVRIHGPAKP
jgi:hypothetical protein